MSLFSKNELAKEQASKPESSKQELSKPEVVLCKKCGKNLEGVKLVKNHNICYRCGGYFRMSTKHRLKMIADHGSFIPWFEDIPVANPLDFPDYENKVLEAKDKTGLHEAVTIGYATIHHEPVILGICDARFMMASMGYVVGEKITRAFEEATRKRLPVVIYCCSGGARMQEGVVSLMQMAKTSGAIKRHSEAGLFYTAVLTDPTTGGVTASFAMLGDVVLAEPGAMIGFAGPRVIEQTIGQKLPEGFQSAEFLVEHGIIDGVIARRNQKMVLHFLLKAGRQRNGYDHFLKNDHIHFRLSEILNERIHKESIARSAWQKVKDARKIERPSTSDYVSRIFDFFIESHGDRAFADDKAILGGLAFLDGQPVVIVGQEKGKDISECKKRNFGMPQPEGYRKALRLMKMADKFGMPIISFVNTSGAYPGIEAEERGQGEAIARNLYEMSSFKVPILTILIGEGGSGGALALAVANEVWMLENAIYSILSPEGFASILWKDSARAEEASGIMKITADELQKLGVIEKIIPEYGGAGHDTIDAIAGNLKEQMKEFLSKYHNHSKEDIQNERYDRFRKL